ncbi:MAG: hypothetical protein HPY65_07660 [Syntrophaceae bacterium]|nr:hypothetical protein [Syntrophaceae bacterium]
MGRKLCMAILIAGFISGSWQLSRAQTYKCEDIPKQTAYCTVDYNSTSDRPSNISCRPAGGAPPSDIVCKIIFSPLPGYTWTGVKDYNWLCADTIIIPNNLFQDMKSVCNKLCGVCRDGWN